VLRRFSILLLVMFISNVSSSKASILSFKRLDELAEYSELIIEGTISNIEVDSLYMEDLYSIVYRTHITITISDILAGFYEQNTIEVSLFGGFIYGKGGQVWTGYRYDYNVSDNIIVFCDYRSDFDNRYLVRHDGIFIDGKDRIQGDGVSIKDIASVKKHLLSVTDNRTINGLERRSSLVVRGRFVELRSDNFYVFSIDRIYKGNSGIHNIVVAYQNVFGTQQPPQFWRQSLYKEYEIGKEYILFLNSENGIYYPFAGRNSIYEIDGDDIVITNRRMVNYRAIIENELTGESR
jgi:hypothetical protein